MLNYNKSFRESTGKSARKSIYSGNKLHTTSMNIKVSNDTVNEFMGLPLKQIICNKRQQDRNRNREQQKIRMSKKHKYSNVNKTQQQSALKKSINPIGKSQHKNHYDETTARILQTQRFNRETGTYRRSIEIFKPKQQRIKTDINEQIMESISKIKRKVYHQKNRSDLSPSPFKKGSQNYEYANTNRVTYHQTGSTSGSSMIQIKADDLKSLVNAVKALKKDKEILMDELKFFKRASNKQNTCNSVMKALGA